MIHSKSLSKGDREEILDNVRKKATDKWNESPLYDELLALEKDAAKIVYDRQLEMVPAKDRKVLDRYGSGDSDTLFNVIIDEAKGTPRTPFYNSNNKGAVVRLVSYSIGGSKPEDYPYYNDRWIELIHEARPDLLPRYCELWNLRLCEAENAAKAFGKLVYPCNTTKQIYDIEELRPFMPKWMKEWRPTKKSDRAAASQTSKGDKAIIADLVD